VILCTLSCQCGCKTSYVIVGRMTLKRLLIQDLRNLISVDINPSDQVNLIFGENGSGKTSLLEAISLLALGRSFRGHKHKALICRDKTAFVVFGRVASVEGAEIPIGINRHTDGTANFKANGDLVSSAADLAGYLPVQVIDAEAFLLLDGAPKVRRQFVDWLVFHVEPTFFQLWKDCQRCLKHRNSLLRRDRMAGLKAPNLVELASWDRELVLLTEQIHRLRARCIDKFNISFCELIKEFVSVDGINISYYAGWDTDRPYGEILESGLERDYQTGYTHVGSNRADLRIKVHTQNAAEILSRGQQKLLVCALKIAQGYVFSQMTGRKTVYLDEKHRILLTTWLKIMDTQVFITGVEKEALVATWRDTPESAVKLFHVEQGRVKEVIETLIELPVSAA
jgi:DNA replication and repair protein RecF